MSTFNNLWLAMILMSWLPINSYFDGKLFVDFKAITWFARKDYAQSGVAIIVKCHNIWGITAMGSILEIPSRVEVCGYSLGLIIWKLYISTYLKV